MTHLRPLLFFLFLAAGLTVGCKKNDTPAEPTCSEKGPSCQPVTNCTDSVRTVEIPDLPMPEIRAWFNPKVGFLDYLPSNDTSSTSVVATYVINSRQESATLGQSTDVRLSKLDFCQYTALVYDVHYPGCRGPVQQMLTRQCDQFVFTSLVTFGAWGCPDPQSNYTIRYFVAVPKLSACAQVQFDITVQ